MVAFLAPLLALAPYVGAVLIPAAGAAILVFLEEIIKALKKILPGN